LLSRVLLIDVSVLAIWGRAGVAIHACRAVHERIVVVVGGIRLVRRVSRESRHGMREDGASAEAGKRRRRRIRPGRAMGPGESFYTLIELLEARESDGDGVGGRAKAGDAGERGAIPRDARERRG